jgi:predicted O-linked N-acetylglucosamine transferase (SPINDLY family)
MASVAELLAAASEHYQAGRCELAIDCLRTALHLNPNIPQAHSNLGITLAEQGRLEEAVASFRQAVQYQPDFAAGHSNLGNALRQMGRLEEAAVSLREALRLRPDFAEAHNNLGTTLQELGRLGEAEASLQQALRLRPDFIDASYNLGMVLAKQGRLDDALEQCHQTLRQKPDHAEAHLNLGNVLREQGRLDLALAACLEALRIKPDYAEAHNNLGIVLQAQGKLAEAIASYERALECRPAFAEAQQNLGNCLKEVGRLDDALVAFRAARSLQPGAARIHSGLVLALNYHPGYDARAIYEECVRWNQEHAEPLAKLIRPHFNDPDPARRLRIGYVSPDFREHSCSAFTIPLLSKHDHTFFEIFCYADVSRPDAITDRLRGHADVWRSTWALSDDELADLVRGDGIDILVDLAMHTGNNRLLVFARKPAPVQVTWLAYPGTTGLDAIDYRLTDPYLDPPGLFDAFYAEKSIRLPDTFWCYDTLTEQPTVNSLPALESGIVTFSCLNNFCKVNEGCLALWADVLREVPWSRLLLFAPRGQAREQALVRLGQQGITEKRIEFVDRLGRQQYLRLYRRIDIALDPFPCNGGTTTFDACSMGIPTITLVGKTVVGRAGWSVLCNLGLEELAAQRPEEYMSLAVRWANDLANLRELRGTLRQRMQQSPLMDSQRFARHVEKAYRQMWHCWCSEHGPRALTQAGNRDPRTPPEGRRPDV